MEMMDMGKKSEGSIPVGGEKEKVRINYPSFSISGDKIPEELSNAKVGEKCRCEIIIKKIGDSIDTYNKGENRIEVEIHSLGVIGKAGKLAKEEYLALPDDKREEYDKKQVEEDSKEAEEEPEAETEADTQQ